MRLGYFTMPVHPLHRSWTETLKQDREAIILADKLGFASAFVGEHLTDRCENVTNSMTFLATLIPETKQIKLATGTSNLSQMHPGCDATIPSSESEMTATAPSHAKTILRTRSPGLTLKTFLSSSCAPVSGSLWKTPLPHERIPIS